MIVYQDTFGVNFYHGKVFMCVFKEQQNIVQRILLLSHTHSNGIGFWGGNFYNYVGMYC